MKNTLSRVFRSRRARYLVFLFVVLSLGGVVYGFARSIIDDPGKIQESHVQEGTVESGACIDCPPTGQAGEAAGDVQDGRLGTGPGRGGQAGDAHSNQGSGGGRGGN